TGLHDTELTGECKRVRQRGEGGRCLAERQVAVLIDVGVCSTRNANGIRAGVKVVVAGAAWTRLADQAMGLVVVGNQGAAAVVRRHSVSQASRIDQEVGLGAIDVLTDEETQRTVLERCERAVRSSDRYQLVEIVVGVGGDAASVSD